MWQISRRVVCSAVAIWFINGLVLAQPVVPGLSNKHPLSLPQVGQLLIGELRCAACHGGLPSNSFPDRSAPDLSDVGARVAPNFLRRFLASPKSAHPGSTMPDLLASESAERRDQIAEALTHFLIAQSPNQFHIDKSKEQDRTTGRELFHSVGCIACHAQRDDEGKEIASGGVVTLAHLASKYNRRSLSDFLYQPLRVRSAGRMPDMKLTKVESQAIGEYLVGDANEDQIPFQLQDPLVSEGKKYFLEFNCVACHKLADFPEPEPVSLLGIADITRGCLSKSISKSPQFRLDEAQLNAIREALANTSDGESSDEADNGQVAKTMVAFNCVACHIRDEYGGVSEDRNPLFQTSEKNIGDDGRIPPPLTLVGAKLQPAWMKKVLFDGESIRHYMFTRMPQYGEPNLRHLTALLQRTDVLTGVDMKIPNPESRDKSEKEREKLLRTGGRELLGDKGLFCIACHSFNGKPAPINKGIDLTTTYQRLQPAWFNEFVRNPSRYRPRIVMPFSWPGGKAAHTTILDGDTDKQIEAIWYYLSLGTSAADPSGMRGVESKLTVTDTTRTYRGRSNVAGFRGIAVGFPEKLSYAFNAETGSLSTIWQGEYIRVDRSGQGSGSFTPASPSIPLHQDVSFAELLDAEAPWPLRPVMTKENPVNPNPLYPKNLGYQFRGYFLDNESIPTLMYQFRDIEIQDHSKAINAISQLRLNRTLQFASPHEHLIWFRALVGEIETESTLEFKTPKLRIVISPDQALGSNAFVQTLVRPSSSDSKLSELLLRLELPKNQSTLSLTYEILTK